MDSWHTRICWELSLSDVTVFSPFKEDERLEVVTVCWNGQSAYESMNSVSYWSPFIHCISALPLDGGVRVHWFKTAVRSMVITNFTCTSHQRCCSSYPRWNFWPQNCLTLQNTVNCCLLKIFLSSVLFIQRVTWFNLIICPSTNYARAICKYINMYCVRIWTGTSQYLSINDPSKLHRLTFQWTNYTEYQQ